MVTNDTFLRFFYCSRKAYLKAHNCPGQLVEIEKVQLGLDHSYLQKAVEEFVATAPTSAVARNPFSLKAALRAGPRFIVNATAVAGNVASSIHLLEGAGGTERLGFPVYTPVLFIPNNRVSRLDKLLLAFNAFALASVQGTKPTAGKIVHGDCRKVVRVKVGPLVEEVLRIIAEAEETLAEVAAPQVTLNPHCTSCEFRNACRKAAEDTDDLSLLRGLSEKDIRKLRARGVTTVTQFSHTYQPGRRGKRRSGKSRKHDVALQARALREQKVYVMDSPQVPGCGVALYLDVEGVPDRDFVYLIGLIAVRDGAAIPYSFWADGPDQEMAIWGACAQVIEDFPDYTLYHYGSYEQRFLDRMAKASGELAVAADRIRARSCNVLGTIYSHVYFPTRSNGLKDVAAFLGMTWSSPAASGIQALAWRLAWETVGDEELKKHLLL